MNNFMFLLCSSLCVLAQVQVPLALAVHRMVLEAQGIWGCILFASAYMAVLAAQLAFVHCSGCTTIPSLIWLAFLCLVFHYAVAP